ncbi:protein kinase family protein [Actinophytocola sp. KF-1]
MPATLAGRYRLLHPVWGDRYGMTHIAAGPDGMPVSVRVLSPDPPAVRRADVDLLTAIRHPNVAAVRDVLVDGHVAIATDAVLGGTLRRARLTTAELLHVADGVRAALAELHTRGVCHGTIGPSAVVVDDRGDAVLTDVAIGRLLRLPGTPAEDHQALACLLSTVWRNTHGRWQRPPRALRDVWADTMARARDMG